ncbi:uncharacterized protein (UPF0335 family) [Martelella mediterranea]|uniref:UPF0335 protein EDC90_103226 n=1 Tax=Martelella mediterranea TaxID=293089 RepID=A0A4V6P068_9HYPH|nr:uncharacterized protein (UPF0335 family) [Martelella mediterranea]
MNTHDDSYDPLAVAGQDRTEENRKVRKDVKAGGPNVARDQLRAFIERVERLEEEKSTIADDIKSVYSEAKASGFDTKAMRKIVRLRGQDEQKLAEEEAILDSYKAALGMLPLFENDGDAA